jgi:hypothetical protein
MALTRLQSSSFYMSQVGQSKYTFVVQVDGNGLVSVRDIRGPGGLVQDPFTTLPSQTIDDIYAAKGLTIDLLAQTSLSSGTVALVAATSGSVVFVTPLANANYRVALTFDPIGPTGYTTSKTTTGFSFTLSSTYTGNVGYTVFQKASSTSGYSGTATFSAGVLDYAVVFTSPTADVNYRVILTPGGFYPAGVVSKTTGGFTVRLGIGLFGLQTAQVGFDVFT